jgi:hypothetical protein
MLVVPRLIDLDSYPNPWDQDEAVFLATAHAVHNGSPLYQPTFCAQPPVMPLSLARAFRLFGESVETGRLVTLLFGCAGVLGIAWITWRLAGGVAAGVAAVSLASSFLYVRQSWCCEATAPALAGSLLGIAIALESAVRRSPAWSGFAGVVFAAGVMSKLLVAPLLVVAALTLALDRENGRWRLRINRGQWLSGAAAATGLVVGVMLLSVGHFMADLYDQVIRFHFVKSGNYERSGNLAFLIHNTARDFGMVGLAAVGLLTLARRDRLVQLAWIITWLAVTAIFLLAHRPLHPHHVVLLAPPIAVVAGVGASALAARRSRWVLGVLAVATLICVDRGIPGLGVRGDLSITVGPLRNYHRLVDRPVGESEAAVLHTLQQLTGPADLIVTDDPKLAYWAGRGIPALLCDPSIERIEASYLSLDVAIRGTRQARAIVLWRGWLERIPGFKAWVQEHFHPVLSIDEQRVVFLANRERD